MVATPWSEAEILKKIKVIKNDGWTKKKKRQQEASQLPTSLCYSARVGNVTVRGLL